MTTTATQTTTYTEARAREVTRKAWADFEGFVASEILTRQRLETFLEDLRQFLAYGGVEWFELQIEKPGGKLCSVRYVVDASGSVIGNDASGGLNPWALPSGSTSSFVIRFRDEALKKEQFLALRNQLGWTQSARVVDGEIRQDRVYSKDGYALRRAIVGSFSS